MATSIAHICSISMEITKENGDPYWEWLYAVPLLHQLQLENGVKHDYTSIDPNKPNWGVKGFDMSNLLDFSGHIRSKRYIHK